MHVCVRVCVYMDSPIHAPVLAHLFLYISVQSDLKILKLYNLQI